MKSFFFFLASDQQVTENVCFSVSFIIGLFQTDR